MNSDLLETKPDTDPISGAGNVDRGLDLMGFANSLDYELADRNKAERKGRVTVHLVVTPRPGAVASVGSLCGVTFKITDALAVRINGLPKGWRKLGDEFTQCPDFQFAVQTYGYPDPDGSLDFGPSILIPKPVRSEAS